MQYIEFTMEEKAKLFDEIAANYYNSNFGQMSKSDIERLLMQWIYS